jgi:hypothetical protein
MNKLLEKKHYKRLFVFNFSKVNSFIKVDDADCDVARQYQYVCK